ncbi:MAG: polysaccharide deacetylase family protein [Oscillospiraceae bacterium]|nr:polysaccharide deacetylase family protein [Oscillospiraceae bacterium]
MSLYKKMAAAVALCVLLLLVNLEPWLWRSDVKKLPVLMYHHFDTVSEMDTVVSVERFREQMTALKAAGYTTVTPTQILRYVDRGAALPEKSVLITMDDGYTSNVTEAAPILHELGMCATVFVIGINEGETVYAHTGEPLYPARFSYEEALPWVENGTLTLQSHTYDMHQLESYGCGGRDGILPEEGENTENYCDALRTDLEKFRERYEAHGIETPLVALAYPFGYFCDEARGVLEEAGIRMTFTVIEGSNLLRVGDDECLWNMGRYNVTERMSGEELVEWLEHVS